MSKCDCGGTSCADCAWQAAEVQIAALKREVEERTRERDAAISAEMAWQEGAQHVLRERQKIAELVGFDPSKLFLDYGMSDVERAIRHRVREASECKAFAERAETAEALAAEFAGVARAAQAYRNARPYWSGSLLKYGRPLDAALAGLSAEARKVLEGTR